MRLNRLETWMMNNPARAMLQRGFEARRLLEMGGPLPPKTTALEIGCGRGIGVELLFDVFGARRVDACDLDPKMVALARARLSRYGDRVRLWTGDACAIPVETGSYGAVFDFGVIHHVPAWRSCIKEIARVLAPGGRLYAEEVLEAFILHPLWRRLLDHPLTNRFDRSEFASALGDEGLDLISSRQMWGQFAWFVADKPPLRRR